MRYRGGDIELVVLPNRVLDTGGLLSSGVLAQWSSHKPDWGVQFLSEGGGLTCHWLLGSIFHLLCLSFCLVASLITLPPIETIKFQNTEMLHPCAAHYSLHSEAQVSQLRSGRRHRRGSTPSPGPSPSVRPQLVSHWSSPVTWHQAEQHHWMPAQPRQLFS